MQQVKFNIKQNNNDYHANNKAQVLFEIINSPKFICFSEDMLPISSGMAPVSIFDPVKSDQSKYTERADKSSFQSLSIAN